MLQFMFPGVKILITLLYRIELLLHQLLPLLLSERLPVESLELRLELLDLLLSLRLQLLLLLYLKLTVPLLQCRRRELLRVQLLIVQGLTEVHLYIGLDHAYLILRPALNDIDEVVPPVILYVDRVALHQTRVVRELLLQDRLRVRQVNERGLVGLEHHEFTFL